MLEFCCNKTCVCWNLTNALKHKVRLVWSIISLSNYLQTSHAEMLLKHYKRQR